MLGCLLKVLLAKCQEVTCCRSGERKSKLKIVCGNICTWICEKKWETPDYTLLRSAIKETGKPEAPSCHSSTVKLCDIVSYLEDIFCSLINVQRLFLLNYRKTVDTFDGILTLQTMLLSAIWFSSLLTVLCTGLIYLVHFVWFRVRCFGQFRFMQSVEPGMAYLVPGCGNQRTAEAFH